MKKFISKIANFKKISKKLLLVLNKIVSLQNSE